MFIFKYETGMVIIFWKLWQSYSNKETKESSMQAKARFPVDEYLAAVQMKC